MSVVLAPAGLVKSLNRYQSSMPKLAQWAENNIPEGLTVFVLDLCGFNRKRLRTSNRIEWLNQNVKQKTKVAKIIC
jgi:transposase-like protein